MIKSQGGQDESGRHVARFEFGYYSRSFGHCTGSNARWTPAGNFGKSDDLKSTSEAVAEQQTSIQIPAPRLQPELGATSNDEPQFERWNNLFTFQERKFYHLLKQILGSEYQIFSKMRMADIVKITNEPKDKQRYINLTLVRHIDFVICNSQQQIPLLGIELDDSSHAKYDRAESDKFKDSVFQQVGLPLLRFQVQQMYDQEQVEIRIREALGDSFSAQNTKRRENLARRQPSA